MRQLTQNLIFILAILVTTQLAYGANSSVCKGIKSPHATTRLVISGNLDAESSLVNLSSIPSTTGTPPTTTYEDLSAVATYYTTVEIYDSLGASHTLYIMFFHTGANSYTSRLYINNEETDVLPVTASGFPREITNSANLSDITLNFSGKGKRFPPLRPKDQDFRAAINWNNGSNSSKVRVRFSHITQYAHPSIVTRIAKNGRAASVCSTSKN